jgi:rRNA small subunit pseudouridine methyltransferase Nep1
LRSHPNLTLYFSISFLAKAACCLARVASSCAVVVESSSSFLAAMVAWCFASFRFIGGIYLASSRKVINREPKKPCWTAVKLHFVIAEAAFELIPESLWRESSVRSDAARRDQEPGSILLDRSIHHSAMLKLSDGFRRGRPDLVHLTLLTVTSTPLHQEGKAKVYIHTLDDKVLEFGEGARPPKSYARFRNLMEKLLVERPEEGLVTVRDATLPQLLKGIGTDHSAGLSVQGAPLRLEDLASDLVQRKNPAVVVGGFPRGHFLPRDLKAFDSLVRIDDTALDAHVVAARVVYEVEKATRPVSNHPPKG